MAVINTAEAGDGRDTAVAGDGAPAEAGDGTVSAVAAESTHEMPPGVDVGGVNGKAGARTGRFKSRSTGTRRARGGRPSGRSTFHGPPWPARPTSYGITLCLRGARPARGAARLYQGLGVRMAARMKPATKAGTGAFVI